MENRTIYEASDERRHGRGRRGNLTPSHMDSDPMQENGLTQSPTQPAESDSMDLPTTTKASKQRQRMTWTPEMNKHVIRCYFKATRLNEDLTGYRTLLYQYFQKYQKFPQIHHLTEQRISDQYRIIIRNKRLSNFEIDILRNEVATELNQTPNQTQTQPQIPIETTVTYNLTGHMPTIRTNPSPPQNANQNGAVAPPQNQDNNIIDDLIANKIKWTDTNPSTRPRLTRLKTNKTTPTIIAQINNALSHLISEVNNMTELHTLLYCAAIVTLKLHDQEPITESTNKRNK